ncbi:hypothetical protein [Nostoc sp. 106C]|uniref:hypothetical protein n=1 Tax=Nostoc sp. 106C TaxID=1932667 RepID=UPI001FB6D965|nr:hypothetical protein [Nostoc sp. 106C]
MGKIQALTTQRQVFVPTSQIVNDLRAIMPLAQIDVVTLSGYPSTEFRENSCCCEQSYQTTNGSFNK